METLRRISRTQKPAGLAIPLQPVKEHLRVQGYDTENAVIASYIDSACEFIFQETGIIVQSASYTGYLDSWESDIVIKRHPVTAISSIKYDDADGVEQTMVEDTDYYVSLNGNYARIHFINTPTLKSDAYDVIRIAFVAGYATHFAIPDDLIHAIKLLVSDAFNTRNSQTAGMSVNENLVPQSVKIILANNSIKDFG